GSSGQWRINWFGTSDESNANTYFTFNWSTGPNNAKEIIVTAYDSNNKEQEFTYKATPPQHKITSKYFDSGDASEVYWNTDSGSGYTVDMDGSKKCWDSSYQNIPCN